MPETPLTPERWQRVKSILLSVLDRPRNEWDAYLLIACNGDDAMLRDVQSLLDAHERSGSLTADIGVFLPRLADGQTIAQYRIVSLAGRGGMGEVYLARDTVLERNVAVKLLPSEFNGRSGRIMRFHQEARAASALSHPNILTIYEAGEHEGTPYIVTEFIEGITLRQRMQEEFPDLLAVLDISIQIAAALSAAHAAGVVHRDVKPENVMLRRDGIVKVLDFGLAKLRTATESGRGSSRNLTLAGALMGTPQYMSPEQARGLEADARSDIFSLGVILFEMTAGQPPFQGHTLEVLNRIQTSPVPTLSKLRPGVPDPLCRLIAKALAKEPGQRYQSAAEMEADLRRLRREMEDTRHAANWLRPFRRHRLPAGIALLAAVALLIGVYGWMNSRDGVRQEFVSVPLTAYPGYESYASVSPDGKQVAFSWNGNKLENYDIYIRLIGSGAPLRLTSDPAEDTAPAWSPDGSSVAFLRRDSSNASIMLVPMLGGVERKLAVVLASSDILYSPSLSWSPDGRWLAVSGRASDQGPMAVSLISADTGEKRQITFPSSTDLGDFYAAFSPDGRTLAFVRSTAIRADDLYLISLGANAVPVGEPRRLTSDNRELAGFTWTADGKELVFSSNRDGAVALWRVPVSGSRAAQRLNVGENGINPSISRQGLRLVYTQSITDTNIWRVNLADPREAPSQVVTSSRHESSAQFSPDGKRISFESNRSGNNEAWLCDFDGSNPIQLVKTGRSGSPRWSPDGQWLTFDSHVEGRWQVYVVSAQGGRPRRVTKSAANDVRPSWSADGKWIYFASNRSTGANPWQIWKIPAAGGDAVQITRQGGFCPFASRDGKTIYFAKGAFGASPLWKVPVDGGEESRVLDSISAFSSGFAVARDGIYYFSGTRLQYLDFSSGVSRSIRTMERPTGLGLAVSPDEKWLLYTQIDQGGSDLMLVENFR